MFIEKQGREKHQQHQNKQKQQKQQQQQQQQLTTVPPFPRLIRPGSFICNPSLRGGCSGIFAFPIRFRLFFQ